MPTNSEIKELAEIIHRYKYSMNCTDNSGQSHADKCNRKDSLCVPCKEEDFASFILKAGYIKKSPVPADIEGKIDKILKDPVRAYDAVLGHPEYTVYIHGASISHIKQRLIPLLRPKLELTLLEKYKYLQKLTEQHLSQYLMNKLERIVDGKDLRMEIAKTKDEIDLIEAQLLAGGK